MMQKIPSYLFQREKQILADPNCTDEITKKMMYRIVDSLVQADIEWRLLSGGVEQVGYPSISPSATLGNVRGGDSGGYDVLDHEAERLQQRSPMAVCAREMMVKLHDRQHSALLLASYPGRSPRGAGVARVGGNNSRSLSLEGVVKLQNEIAKELGFSIPFPFPSATSVKVAALRAREKMLQMLNDVL